MPLQVQKGKFVVMAACAASGALAFSLAGEQLWLGRVEHRGQDSLKLHYYQQPCARLGKSLNLSSPSSMLDVLSVIIIVRWSYQKSKVGLPSTKGCHSLLPCWTRTNQALSNQWGRCSALYRPLLVTERAHPDADAIPGVCKRLAHSINHKQAALFYVQRSMNTAN